MRGLQSDRTLVFHLPTSPLLGGLIDDVNSTLTRLVEDETNGFIPFPMKRHRRFYRTAAPSLSAPYVVPPSIASLTREKPSYHKRRLIHLSYSVLTGLESALAGIGETISWLDWWLSTVSGFRKALHPSAQADFESHTITCDSLSGQPAAIFSRDSTRLVQSPTMPSSTRTFTLPIFQSDQHRATVGPTPYSADTSGSSRENNQGNSQAANKPNKSRNHRRPFSRSTSRSGNSGGKGKGFGKRSN